MLKVFLASLLMAFGLCPMAQAAVIQASYTNNGGNDWTAAFTLTNDGAPPTIEGFTVYFDPVRFDTLSNPVVPDGWDFFVAAPNDPPQANGVYDAFVLADPLGNGESLAGFSVDFALIGGGVPGSLPFEIVRFDDDGATVLFSGQTVPEPAPASLLAGALLALALTRYRRR